MVVGIVLSAVSTAVSCGYESTTGDERTRSSSTAVLRDGPVTTMADSVTGSSTSTPVTTTGTVPPVTVTSTTAGNPSTGPSSNATPSRPGAVDVIDVIDGDTIKIAGGQSVRLIGIDTPERGQCGYTEAAFVLASLIRGRPVVLVPGARTDTDRYGRLLRYVEVDGVDVNLEMIRSGRAIARYDSRDGYGRHPREDLYVSTDATTPSTNNCAPPPGGNTGATSGGNGSGAARSGDGGTDPRFGTCKEAKAAGYGGYVRGVDPEYNWYRDGDRDGIACE